MDRMLVNFLIIFAAEVEPMTHCKEAWNLRPAPSYKLFCCMDYIFQKLHDTYNHKKAIYDTNNDVITKNTLGGVYVDKKPHRKVPKLSKKRGKSQEA